MILSPNTPSVINAYEQYKTDSITPIANTEFTNESTLKFKASATDADLNTTLTFYFEIREKNDTFTSPTIPVLSSTCTTNTGFSGCNSKIWSMATTSGDYRTNPGQVSLSIPGFNNGEYKWQFKVSDGANFSEWRAYQTTLPNFKIDNTAPTFTITDSVGTSWNTADTIAVSVSDTGGSGLGTTMWAYSEDAYCSSNDIFLGTGASIVVSTYQKYVCFKASDNAGNLSYSDAIGPLKWDKTGPVFTVTDGVNPSWNNGDTIIVTVSDPNSPYGPNGIGAGAITAWGFSSDAICDNLDSYSNTGLTTGSITGNHTDYVCFTNTDLLGNVGYSTAIGPLRIGTAVPTFTVTNGVSSIWNVADLISVNATTEAGTLGTTYWGFSANATCDANDTYSNTGSSLTVSSGPHTDYVCFKNTNSLGNTGYSAAIGPLKWDNINPTINSLVLNQNLLQSGKTVNITSSASD